MSLTAARTAYAYRVAAYYAAPTPAKLAARYTALGGYLAARGRLPAGPTPAAAVRRARLARAARLRAALGPALAIRNASRAYGRSATAANLAAYRAAAAVTPAARAAARRAARPYALGAARVTRRLRLIAAINPALYALRLAGRAYRAAGTPRYGPLLPALNRARAAYGALPPGPAATYRAAVAAYYVARAGVRAAAAKYPAAVSPYGLTL